jgi:hypothetical protein
LSNKLRHIIREEIERHLLGEAVSRGVLYHFTSEKGLSVNIKNHGFKFHNMESEYYNDPVINKFESALSTTRLYNLKWGNIRFNLNGDYISSNYVVKPVHFFNRQKDNEYRTKPNIRSFNAGNSVPMNQYEETILSKKPNHIMSLNNNTVFSVDILINNEEDRDEFISKYRSELNELKALGVPYNFVFSFKPFKGVDKVEMSDIKKDVASLLRLSGEGDIITFLRGRDNIKDILSDVRVIIMACSRGYLRLLKEMVRLGVDLGINDYDDTETTNIWTNDVRKAMLKTDDYLAIKAASGNKDVLSVLMTSSAIPIKVKYDVIVDYKLEQFYDMLYNSNLGDKDKLALTVYTNNYSMFDKLFNDSDNKNFTCISVSFRNLDDKFAKKCLSSDISKGVKYKISKKYGIGDAEQYYEEPIPSNDKDLPF